MPEFYLNEDGYLYVTFKKDGEYVDPTTVKLTAYDPTGTASVSAQDMTKSSTGKYYYWVDLNVRGKWIFYVKVTDFDGHRQTDKYEHWVSGERT